MLAEPTDPRLGLQHDGQARKESAVNQQSADPITLVCADAPSSTWNYGNDTNFLMGKVKGEKVQMASQLRLGRMELL